MLLALVTQVASTLLVFVKNDNNDNYDNNNKLMFVRYVCIRPFSDIVALSTEISTCFETLWMQINFWFL